jgi:dihydroorotate dehydrogenase
MSRLYDIARHLLFKLDPETAHDLTLRALRSGFAPRVPAVQDAALEVSLWDRKFPN